jgi:hypothetical protein
VVRSTGTGVERLLADALPESADLDAFVASLDRLVEVALGDAVATERFCRACDADVCLAGPRGCPSDAACRANLAADG